MLVPDASSSGGIGGTLSTSGGSSGRGGSGGIVGTGGKGGAPSIGGTGTAGHAGADGSAAAGAAGAGATGGTGGAVGARTPVCANTATVYGTNPIIGFDNWPAGATSYYQDAASGWIGGAYGYGDNSAAAVVTWGIEAANDTAVRATNALHLNVTNVTTYYSGMGLWMNCTDLHAYTGIAFRAKGTTNPVRVDIAGAMTTSISDPKKTGGTCTAGTCTMEYQIVSLPADWTPYTIKWTDFTLTGLAAVDVTAVNDIEFKMLGNGTLDIWIDNFGFTN